jgi:hypothetical protein
MLLQGEPVSERKERGVEATNRDYIRYEQVEKLQTYHLAEAGHVEAFDEEYRVRTLDLARFLKGDASDRSAFAASSGRRCARSASRSWWATGSTRPSTRRPRRGSSSSSRP